MALSDIQIVQLMDALGEPPECQSAIETKLARLNPARETYLIALLEEWLPLSRDTDLIDVDGVKINSQTTANLLAAKMGNAIGWTISDPGTIIIGRGEVDTFTRFGYQSQTLDAEWSND